MSENSQGKLNLWSANKQNYLNGAFKKLRELRYKGGYYEEIGLPEMDKIFRGLMQDINILKNENAELKQEIENLKK